MIILITNDEFNTINFSNTVSFFFLLKNFPCNGFCLKGEKTKLNKKTKHKENCKIFSQNKVCRHAHFHSYIVVV